MTRVGTSICGSATQGPGHRTPQNVEGLSNGLSLRYSQRVRGAGSKACEVNVIQVGLNGLAAPIDELDAAAITMSGALRAALPAALFVGFCLLGLLVNYLAFHVLAEGFSIVIALSALMVASTSWQFTKHHFLIYIAIGVGWCAVIDVVHTLAFKDMGLLTVVGANAATQLWIAARYLQAAMMLSAPLFLRRKVSAGYVHAGFGLLSVMLLASIATGVFPDAYVEGQGLTPFKIYSEYLIILTLALALFLLWRMGSQLPQKVFLPICASILAMMLSEFAFTRYVSVYAGANMVGHVFKIIAYWFIYVALVQRTVREPFAMLYLAQQSLRDYVARLEQSVLGTVDAVSVMMDMRDPYTSGHERRVGELAAAIGAEMGLDANVQRGLRVAGAVHDVGKIAVPAQILGKPGRISAIEFEMVKTHPQEGYEVLKGIDFPWPVAQIALQHHERLDGSGYPQGLKGEDILLEARVMAVADVIEATASHRPYRPGIGIDKALAEVEQGRGRLYDAKAVDACLRLFYERGYVLPA